MNSMIKRWGRELHDPQGADNKTLAEDFTAHMGQATTHM